MRRDIAALPRELLGMEPGEQGTRAARELPSAWVGDNIVGQQWQLRLLDLLVLEVRELGSQRMEQAQA